MTEEAIKQTRPPAEQRGHNSLNSLFRAASLSLCFFCVAVFGVVAYGSFAIPNSFYVTQEPAQGVNLPEVELPFSLSAEGGQSVSVMQDGQQGSYDMTVSVLRMIPVKSAKLHVTHRRYVIPGGEVFGIKLYTKGVLVVGVDVVSTQTGSQNPGAKAGLKEGDLILSMDGTEITRNAQVSQLIEQSGGRRMELRISRGGKEQTLSLQPQQSQTDGKWRAGIWVRDSSAGLGTLTFQDPENKTFAGLGHAVCDVDTGETLPISAGEAVKATVKGCYKGVNGKPGELCGVFSGESIGALSVNSDAGIYGKLKQADTNAKSIPVALKSEVKPGQAQMIATVDGTDAQYYDVEILKIYQNEESVQKNMIVKVTDSRLLETTGGIVQGMSGSPLVQNGMLVGAVTHVFINNPQQGYAIFAQTMLENADKLAPNKTAKAS